MSSPPLDSSIWTVSDVLSTMRVRDLKRRLQLTHHYTVKQIDKLMSKQDLINAIIKEETTPKSSTAKGAAAAETVKKFFPGKGDDSFQLIVTLVVIIILIIMDLYLEGENLSRRCIVVSVSSLLIRYVPFVVARLRLVFLSLSPSNQIINRLSSSLSALRSPLRWWSPLLVHLNSFLFVVLSTETVI